MDPATIGLVVGAIVNRFVDKEKPLGKTNATTAAGVGFGGAAAILIQSPDETMQIIGYVLGGLGALVALYKEKNE